MKYDDLPDETDVYLEDSPSNLGIWDVVDDLYSELVKHNWVERYESHRGTRGICPVCKDIIDRRWDLNITPMHGNQPLMM